MKINEPDHHELRWNVRRLDNRVGVVISKSGSQFYVSIHDLPVQTAVWVHRPGSSEGGFQSFGDAFEVAEKRYHTVQVAEHCPRCGKHT